MAINFKQLKNIVIKTPGVGFTPKACPHGLPEKVP
jgi:hypothetical protein